MLISKQLGNRDQMNKIFKKVLGMVHLIKKFKLVPWHGHILMTEIKQKEKKKIPKCVCDVCMYDVQVHVQNM